GGARQQREARLAVERGGERLGVVPRAQPHHDVIPAVGELPGRRRHPHLRAVPLPGGPVGPEHVVVQRQAGTDRAPLPERVVIRDRAPVHRVHRLQPRRRVADGDCVAVPGGAAGGLLRAHRIVTAVQERRVDRARVEEVVLDAVIAAVLDVDVADDPVGVALHVEADPVAVGEDGDVLDLDPIRAAAAARNHAVLVVHRAPRGRRRALPENLAARPGAVPPTRTPELPVATEELLLSHVMVRPVSVLPPASFGVAVSCSVWLTNTVAHGGLTLTVATGTVTAVTVTADVPLLPSEV